MYAPRDNESRLLVLASTAKDYELTCEILSRRNIQCERCWDVTELCSKLLEGAGALLVSEEALLSDRNDELSRCLAEQPPWSDVPLILLAARGADSARVANVMESVGTATILERPVRIVTLVSAVSSALRARARQYQVRDDGVALAAARDELEGRVRERTSDLRTANSQLELKISEAEAAEWRAKELLSRLVSAQETERARIARDLHDELGQQLTSLRLHLSHLSRDIPIDAESRRALEVTEEVAERIDSRVSFLAWMIRPSAIEEVGLPRAVEAYVTEWSRNFGIPAAFRSGTKPRRRLTAEIEVNVYRIAQECLNNVAKYAQATAVTVLLTIKKDELKLIVEDDGIGFDPAKVLAANITGGLGLTGMRERAALLNGTLEIESAPNKGTTIYVQIPAEYRKEG
jgi:signal transduction histidine kinase